MKPRAIILGAVVVVGIFMLVLTQQDKGVQTRRAVVGLDAPEFTVLNSNGEEIKLSQFKGKKIFIHYWASWCKECKEEMPGIQALYNRKKSDPGFVFLSIIYREDPLVSRQWLEDNNYNIPIFTDPKGTAAALYGLTGVPETFIVDPDGTLVERILGPGRWDNI